MSGSTLAEFALPCDLGHVWSVFWRDDTFYKDFLVKQGDIDIVLGRWESAGGAAGSFTRSVECSHPVKVSFPGTPSHTRCFRRQSMKFERDPASTRAGSSLILQEDMRFEGIPYSDFFTVQTVWRCVEPAVSGRGGAHGGAFALDPEAGRCQAVEVSVAVGVHFVKSTWLKGTISSNTEAECKEALSLWRSSASAHLEAAPHSTAHHSPLDLSAGGLPAWCTVDPLPAPLLKTPRTALPAALSGAHDEDPGAMTGMDGGPAGSETGPEAGHSSGGALRVGGRAHSGGHHHGASHASLASHASHASHGSLGGGGGGCFGSAHGSGLWSPSGERGSCASLTSYGSAKSSGSGSGEQSSDGQGLESDLFFDAEAPGQHHGLGGPESSPGLDSWSDSEASEACDRSGQPGFSSEGESNASDAGSIDALLGDATATATPAAAAAAA
eukprot:CAMPEP_0172627534 /NCGR_PEP_ID=MMETSP1068-20121228/156765_1 /TAXON_ID=35684 /ORGANISM="Pseudopedinella elastica, Strain CCMP716" /LENGTH=440 /DNA_ID=CAMNT_0013437447 /DNA_START=111 /DNA_END=1431 /DNA_ORIENTATION=-